MVDEVHKIIRVDPVHFLDGIGEFYLVIIGDVLVIEANCRILVDSDDKIVLVSVGLIEQEAVVVEMQSQLDCVRKELHLEF